MFYQCHDGCVMARMGVVALSKTIINPVTQPCAMLMPMVGGSFFFAIHIHECVCFLGAFCRKDSLFCTPTMGPRPSANREASLRLMKVKKDMEMMKKNEEHLWRLRHKPYSVNALNGHSIFAPVDSLKDRKAWRRSWIVQYRAAKTEQEVWYGSQFGIGKWPHMLPVKVTPMTCPCEQCHDRRIIRLLKAGFYHLPPGSHDHNAIKIRTSLIMMSSRLRMMRSRLRMMLIRILSIMMLRPRTSHHVRLRARSSRLKRMSVILTSIGEKWN